MGDKEIIIFGKYQVGNERVYFNYEVSIIKETEKAIQIKVKEEHYRKGIKRNEDEWKFWLPKSQIIYWGKRGVIIPAWLGKKAGSANVALNFYTPGSYNDIEELLNKELELAKNFIDGKGKLRFNIPIKFRD